MSKELQCMPREKRDAFLVALYAAFFEQSACEVYVGNTYLKIVRDWWPCYIRLLDIKYDPSYEQPLVIPSVVLLLDGTRHSDVSLEGDEVYTRLRLPIAGKTVDGQVVQVNGKKLLRSPNR